MRTSLGYHTFNIFLRLTYSEAMSLYRAFQKYEDVNVRPLGKQDKNSNALPKAYIVEYSEKSKGISWYVRFDDELSKYMQPSLNHLNHSYQKEPTPYSVRARINPKLFSGVKDYLSAANYSCLDVVRGKFNEEAIRISPILGAFEDYSMNRTDYCLNIDVVELKLGCSAEQMIALIKRGDIPESFTEWKKNNEISKRMEPKKTAHYLQNKSVTINYYWKYGELLDKWPDCPDLEASRNLIRLEVQCKYPKVYSMSKSIRNNSKTDKSMSVDDLWEGLTYGRIISNPIDALLADSIAFDTIRQYFNKVIGTGDYYSLDVARGKVRSQNCHLKVKERLISALELINRCRGISKAKATLCDDELEGFLRSLKNLKEIGINPVTIPREWGIPRIPNLFNAYMDKIADEHAKEMHEKLWNEIGC